MTTPKITLGIIFIFLNIVKIQTTSVSQCTIIENVPLPDEVEIEGCVDPPCIFPVNTTINITMNFKSPRNLKHITAQAIGETLNLVISLPLEQEDACDGIVNTDCPLELDENVEYTSQLSVSSGFGEISFALEFSLLDVDQDSYFECFRVNVRMMITD